MLKIIIERKIAKVEFVKFYKDAYNIFSIPVCRILSVLKKNCSLNNPLYMYESIISLLQFIWHQHIHQRCTWIIITLISTCPLWGSQTNILIPGICEQYIYIRTKSCAERHGPFCSGNQQGSYCNSRIPTDTIFLYVLLQFIAQDSSDQTFTLKK